MSDMAGVMRAWRLLGSPFVDEEIYRRSLGGGRADVTTVTRYLRIPVAERPLLSFYFDPFFYGVRNHEVLAEGEDPLLHFLEHGFAEGRSPHPLVDLAFLTSQDPHALGLPPRIEALVDILEHDRAAPSPYFDLDFYAEHLGPNAPARGLLRHFVTQGVWAQRLPNNWLDPLWYADRNPDSPKDPYGAMRHFIMQGDPAGRPARASMASCIGSATRTSPPPAPRRYGTS